MDNTTNNNITTSTPSENAAHDVSDVKELSEALTPVVEEYESDNSDNDVDDTVLFLTHAARHGDLDSLKKYVEKDPNCLNCVEEELNLLHFATRHPEVIQYLTNRDENLYEYFNDGTTDLIAAAASGDYDFIQKEVRAHPARLLEKTEREETIFYWAGFLLNDEYLNKLIELLIEITTAAIISENLPKDTLQYELDDAWKSAAAGAYDFADTYNGNDPAAVIDAARYAIICVTKMSRLKNKDKQDMKVYLKRIYNLHVCNNDHGSACFALIERLPYMKTNKLASTYHFIYMHYFKSMTSAPNINQATAINQFFILLNYIRDAKGIDYYSLADVRESLDQLKKDFQLFNYTGNLGFHLHDVPHDGNCFFHAIISQLNIYNIKTTVPLDHMALRLMACSHIRTHSELYRDHLEGTIYDYLEIMRKEDEWADNLVILSLSRILNATIVILRSDATKPNIFKRPNPVCTFFLIYDVPMHYQSLQIGRPLVERDDKILKELKDTEADAFSNDDSILQISSASRAPVLYKVDNQDVMQAPPIMPSPHAFFSSPANNSSSPNIEEKRAHRM